MRSRRREVGTTFSQAMKNNVPWQLLGLDPSIMGVRLSDEADSASAVTSLALSNVQLGAPRLTDTSLSSVPNVVRSLFGVIVSAFDSMLGMVGYGSSHFMPLWLK